MWDYLTFERFITPLVLPIVYYLGAALMPLAILFIYGTLKKRAGEYTKVDLSVNVGYKYLFTIGVVICFLCMELFWRMMFEFMIAYFDMHDALTKLAQ